MSTTYVPALPPTVWPAAAPASVMGRGVTPNVMSTGRAQAPTIAAMPFGVVVTGTGSPATLTT